MSYQIPQTINESIAFPILDEEQKSVVIDFSRHLYMNSNGIAAWIKWVNECGAKKITLINVSVQFLSQVAMISSLVTDNCEIESFKVPLYSEELQEEKELLVSINDVEDDGSGNLNLLFDYATDERASDWEIDVNPESYFEVIISQLRRG